MPNDCSGREGRRVCRGGSFLDLSVNARWAVLRFDLEPGDFNDNGFRVVVSPLVFF
jgi:hypothetical protein